MPIAVAQGCVFEVCSLARQSVILLFGHVSFNALHGASLPWTHLLPDNGGWLPADTVDPIHGAVRQLTNGNLLMSLHDGSGPTTIGVNDDALKAHMTQGYQVARDHGLHCLITNGCPPIEEVHAKPTSSVLDARRAVRRPYPRSALPAVRLTGLRARREWQSNPDDRRSRCRPSPCPERRCPAEGRGRCCNR